MLIICKKKCDRFVQKITTCLTSGRQTCSNDINLLNPWKVDIAIAGFPCVSLSHLTTTPGGIKDTSCSSGLGFDSVKAYLRRHRPELALLENVATVFHKRKADNGESPQHGKSLWIF